MLSLKDERFRRSVSDISTEIEKLGKDYEVLVKINELEQAECECCGITEECTPDYISQVKDSFSGKWLCGLCSEAVKENQMRSPRTAMEESVDSHKVFSQDFNTTRSNPKLSLAWAMRDMVKRRSQDRITKNSSASKIVRTSSCVPRIEMTDWKYGQS